MRFCAARRSGANAGEQIAYGGMVAGVEVLTEKMFDGLAGIYGKGAADEVVDQVIGKLAKTTAGRNALRVLSSMSGEALEEVVSGIVDPALESIYNGKNVRGNYSADTAADVLHDAIIGGLLGLFGGSAEIARDWRTEDGARRTSDAMDEIQPVMVGRATIIKNPYQGTTPNQEKYTHEPVVVMEEAIFRAENRIRQALNESERDGVGFKASLKKIYRGIFDSKHNVPVFGLTFKGEPYLVQIGNGVPKKVISDPNLSVEKLALLDDLATVVANGEYLGSGTYTSHGSKNKPVIRYDYFETPISIVTMDANKNPVKHQYIAKFDVEVFPGANNYRTHQIVNVDLITSEARLAGPEPVPSVDESSPQVHLIAQQADTVKDFYRTTSPYASALRQLMAEGKVLSPEQRAILEEWNKRFPEMRMDDDEFLKR